jgi:hypothetical protein
MEQAAVEKLKNMTGSWLNNQVKSIHEIAYEDKGFLVLAGLILDEPSPLAMSVFYISLLSCPSPPEGRLHVCTPH